MLCWSLNPVCRIILYLVCSHCTAQLLRRNTMPSTEVIHGLSLHRRCIVLRCALPSHLGPPVYPLPLTAAETPSPDAGLTAIGLSIGAGGLPISLPAQQDGKGCPDLPLRVRTTDGHQTDAKSQGGHVVPVLLRADGISAAFAPLPLQARHLPCRSGGPMAAVRRCPLPRMHVRRLRRSPSSYGAMYSR